MASTIVSRAPARLSSIAGTVALIERAVSDSLTHRRTTCVQVASIDQALAVLVATHASMGYSIDHGSDQDTLHAWGYTLDGAPSWRIEAFRLVGSDA